MTVADEPQYGPAMMALPEKRRLFVLAMCSDPLGNPSKWARAAGYADCGANARVKGHHAIHDPRLEAAVLEVSRSMMATVGPALAASALIRMARNPNDRNHARAVEMLANRVGLHEVQEVHVHRTDGTGAAMMERIRALAAKHGMDAEALLAGMGAKQIEGKVIDERASGELDARAERFEPVSEGRVTDTVGGAGSADDGGQE